jgi:hypothetical protein
MVLLVNTNVILNLFQDNTRPSPVILKQVQDDDGWNMHDGVWNLA